MVVKNVITCKDGICLRDQSMMHLSCVGVADRADCYCERVIVCKLNLYSGCTGMHGCVLNDVKNFVGNRFAEHKSKGLG